ncbi:ribulose-phosphate 3-epimerase [Brevundimonas faecalis]|uniref:Ribulose-phosphate 3-epimerase n=2 Tax=Brevundimonas faecalis TaxID=947378 RepID=A0ABV2RBW6_9CAUL
MAGVLEGVVKKSPSSSPAPPSLASGLAPSTVAPSPTTTADRSRSASEHLSPSPVAALRQRPGLPPAPRGRKSQTMTQTTATAPLICPSILASDFAKLGEEIRALETAGADWIHVDVMDGHFVPNLTIGPDVVKALRPHTNLPFDVHLMVAPVDNWLEAYRAAGADIMSVHPESGPHVHRTLGQIRQLGAKAGLVFNPATPLSVLEEAVDLVDLVLIMSVNPGFGGQKFIESSLKKIERARAILDRAGSKAHLQVDGGVVAANAGACVAAGADALVAGSFVFKGGPDAYAANIQALKAAAA